MLLDGFYIKQAAKVKDREKRAIRKCIKTANTWFVDIPRTSSTSIKTEMAHKLGAIYGKYYSREDPKNETQSTIEDHTTALEIRRLIGARTWRKIYTFSFVRNPWVRFLSIYRYRLANMDLDAAITFEAYVQSLETPHYYMKDNPFMNRIYHMSMFDYLTDREGELLVDEVFKFENRSAAIDTINQKLQLDIGNLHLEKMPINQDYQQYYTEESRQIIAKFYAKDIQYFGYTF